MQRQIDQDGLSKLTWPWPVTECNAQEEEGQKLSVENKNNDRLFIQSNYVVVYIL